MTPDTTVLTCVDAATFEALAARFLDRNYQQSAAYAGLMAARQRSECELVRFDDGETLLGVAAVRVRPAPVVGGGVAYVAGGPLVRLGAPGDGDVLRRCLTALRTEYVDRRRLLLRVLGSVGSPAWIGVAGEAFREAGLTRTDVPRRYRTLLLSLKPGRDALRDACSKYWRRNLRRAERQPLSYRIDTDPSLFEPIGHLHEAMRQRKGFEAPFDADWLASWQARLTGADRLVAELIERNGEPVAGLISYPLGDTWVPLLLAADLRGLRSYAAYLLQWQSILSAQHRGLDFYDLGGIDPEHNRGVYNFKKGLRGVEVWAPGPWQSVPGPVRGRLIGGAERLYRRVAPRTRPGRPHAAAHRRAADLPGEIRRARACDVDGLARICRLSFPNSLRWQLGGGAARTWWESVLTCRASETWVSAEQGQVQGFCVLVIDEEGWSGQRGSRRAPATRWMTAALRRPAALRAAIARPSGPTRSQAPHLPAPVAGTEAGRRTWIELIAVAPQHRGSGVGTALIDQAESRTRRLNRRALYLGVDATNGDALERYARLGFGLVRRGGNGYVLSKLLPGLVIRP